MGSEIIAAGNDIRENLVATAVNFLRNPNVQQCTLDSKERFLRSKGLTEFEIQRALQQYTGSLDIPTMTSELKFFQRSRANWLKDRVLPLLVYGGFAYGCYWFYKNYIKQMLFVEKPKKKSTDDCIDELRISLDNLNGNVLGMRSDIQCMHVNATLRAQLDNIKADIASVKGILLNRNQFPTIKTRSDPPSIPAWQRQSEEATSSEVLVEEKKKPLRTRSQRSESGGSNSSEGEQATKNSDSSLEIIT